jgi:hypothetical protein
MDCPSNRQGMGEGEQRRILNGNGRAMMKKLVWWLTWLVLTAHLVLLPLLLGIRLSNSAMSGFGWRVVFVVLPLMIAVGLRWLVLPRVGSTILAFFLSLTGLILADMSGLMTVFLEPPHRLVLYCLCVIGMLQFIPLFILRTATRRRPPTDGDARAASG